MSRLPKNKYYSIEKAASCLGVSTKTMRRWEASGKISSIRTEGGHRRYDVALLHTKMHERAELHKARKAYTRKLTDEVTHSFETNDSIFLSNVERKIPGINVELYQAIKLHPEQVRVLKTMAVGFAVLLITVLLTKTTGSLSNSINQYKTTIVEAAINRVSGAYSVGVTQPVQLAQNFNLPGVLAAAAGSPTLNVNVDAIFNGNLSIAGDLVTGGLSTTQTTYNLINTVARTLNIGGAATAVNIGAAGGTTTLKGNLSAADITSIKGVTYSFPTTQGAATTYLKNDGTGTLTWSTVAVSTPTIDLTSNVSGILPIANGGTNNSASYTSGSIIFSNGTKLTQDNAELFWDDTNFRLGIGTSAPTASLNVVGTTVLTGATTITGATNITGATGITGNTTLTGNLTLADTYTINVGGITGKAYNAFANAAQTPTHVTADNDVYVGGNLEVTGTIYGNIAGTLALGLTQGSVPFVDASGGLTESNSNFFYDATHNRLGLGTNAPTAQLDIGALPTTGTIFNLGYKNYTWLTGDIIGSKFDLDNGTIDANDYNVTGLEVSLPTITNVHTTGTKTLKGFYVSFGTGAGINQTGAGGTTNYNALDVTLPALTQTAGTLNANGLYINTPSSITTGGTASGMFIDAHGVGAGALNGINISSITGSTGAETALNIGSGWDNILTVNGTPIINGSGVTQVAGGGTGQSTWTKGDLLYSDADNSLAKLNISPSTGYVLTVGAGGTPQWGTIAGSACTNCLVSNPSSDQIIAPTGDTTGLQVKQTTGVTVKDIFSVTSSAGAKYFYIDSNGVVNIPSIGSSAGDQLTITPGTNKFALKLQGTNVTNQNLEIINSYNTSGTIFNIAYPVATGLAGTLTGINMDLSANVTATNQSVTGQSITLPVATNTNVSGTNTYKGLVISPTAASGYNQNGAGGTTAFYGADITMPALTQTAGTIAAYGINLTTPTSITAGGSAYGINVAATGVGAGTLNGINIGAISGGSGAETAINVGTGWDYAAVLAGAVNIGTSAQFQVSATGNLGMAAGNSIDTLTAGALNIGTTTANTINVGNATGATALNFTSGTGSQTFASLATTNTAFAFNGSAITTGDLLAINASGNTLTSGNLFNVMNNNSSVFSVSGTQVTSNLPTAFNAAGDMGNAYDLVFTNPAGSFIKSASNLTLQTGENFNSSDLTLRTYNLGNILFDTGTSTTGSGKVGIGPSVTPLGLLTVSNQNENATTGQIGKAVAVFDQYETQDILTASASGVTKFTVSNTGLLTTAGGVTTTGGNISMVAGSAIDTSTAGTLNIGTTTANNVTIGNATGAMALNLISGTGTQSFTSSVATTTLTSGAFSFNANALTTGTGMYVNSSTITTGDLLAVNATGTTLTSGNLFNVMNNGSSVFSIGAAQITAGLPTQFTAAGDVLDGYDFVFTNPTASYIKSNAPLYLQAGEVFNSSDLTLKTYNQGSVIIDSAQTTGSAMQIANSTLTTGNLLSLASTSTTANGASLLNLNSSGANGTSSVTNYGMQSTITNTGTSSTNVAAYFSASGANNNYAGIFAAGNVGIGNTAPASTLDVTGSTNISTTLAVGSTTTLSGNLLANNTVISTGTLLNGTGTCSANTNTNSVAVIQTATTFTTAQIFYNSDQGKHSRITSTSTCTDGATPFQILNLTDAITGNVNTNAYTVYSPVTNIGSATSKFIGNVYAINYLGLASTLTGGFDVAEQYPAKDNTIAAGDVVSVDEDGKLVKSGTAYDSKVLGIVSTNPALSLGDEKTGDWRKVALNGRVPVKVTAASDPIKPGDFLTSSNDPGMAMKATSGGNTIGKAVESWVPGDPTVMVLVNNTYVGDMASASSSSSISLSPDQTNMILSSFTATGSGVVAKLAEVDTTKLVVTGDTVLGDTVIAGNLDITGSINTIGALKFMNGLVTIDTNGNLVTKTVTADKYKVAGASAGVGTIKAGQTTVSIDSNSVTDNSMVFVTTSTATTKVLSVTGKTVGSSFKVEISSPDTKDIQFNWWIVDKQ